MADSLLQRLCRTP